MPWTRPGFATSAAANATATDGSLRARPHIIASAALFAASYAGSSVTAGVIAAGAMGPLTGFDQARLSKRLLAASPTPTVIVATVLLIVIMCSSSKGML